MISSLAHLSKITRCLRKWKPEIKMLITGEILGFLTNGGRYPLRHYVLFRMIPRNPCCHPGLNKDASKGHYGLTRRGQVIIFHLCIGQCRLQHHLHHKFGIGESDMCPTLLSQRFLAPAKSLRFQPLLQLAQIWMFRGKRAWK
jgi:hypothetical protein